MYTIIATDPNTGEQGYLHFDANTDAMLDFAPKVTSKRNEAAAFDTSDQAHRFLTDTRRDWRANYEYGSYAPHTGHNKRREDRGTIKAYVQPVGEPEPEVCRIMVRVNGCRPYLRWDAGMDDRRNSVYPVTHDVRDAYQGTRQECANLMTRLRNEVGSRISHSVQPMKAAH